MRLITALLILAASLLLFSCDSTPEVRDEFKRSARVSAAGANDPEERLRDELGEFMVYFERTIGRMESAAIRAALTGDQPELAIGPNLTSTSGTLLPGCVTPFSRGRSMM